MPKLTDAPNLPRPWLGLEQVCVLPHTLAVLAQTVDDLGMDIEPLFTETGLTRAMVNDPDLRLSSQQVLRICAQALRHYRSPLLALRAGLRMNAAACGPYGFALLSSASHAEVLVHIHRYHHLLSPFIAMQFHATDRASWCDLELHPGVERLSPVGQFVLEFKVAGMHSMLQSLYGSTWHLQSVAFRHATPPHAPSFAEALGCPVIWGQPQDRVTLPVQLLRARPSMPNTVANKAMKRLCEDMHPIRSSANLTEQVLALLKSHPCTLEQTTARLATSARMLQRQLSTEGTSFRALQDQARQHRAKELLALGTMSIDAIAVELGYSDPSNFRHAFARWTGETPGHYRQTTHMNHKHER